MYILDYSDPRRCTTIYQKLKVARIDSRPFREDTQTGTQTRSGGGAWTKGFVPVGVFGLGGGGAFGVLCPNDLILPSAALLPPTWTTLSSSAAAAWLHILAVPMESDESAVDTAHALSRRAATRNEVVLAMTN
jgi:hypothetical protein